MSCRRAAATFAMLCVLLAPGVAAHASGGDRDAPLPPPISIHVTAKLPGGCPAEPSLFERIHARIERVREASAPGGEVVDVRIEVLRERATTRGILTVTHGEDQTVRNVTASTCDEALAALVVMAAVALDAITPPAPRTSSSEPVPEREPEPRPDERHHEASAPPRPAPRAKPPSTRRRAQESIAFSSGAALEVHDFGSAVVVPSLFLALSFPGPLRPNLRVAMARSVGAEFVTPSGSAAFAWLYATARECIALGGKALAFGPCVAASVGTLDVHTLPPTYPASLERLWLTLGASARAEWRPLRALSVELTAGFASPLRRDELYFEPQVTVYRTPIFMPFVGTGLAIHVP